ncbi:MAG: arsenic-transporting ATPase [Candidatus Methanomethylicota archaeon]|uniref:Arsenic-transporting ATPase n=1 Tax=Thermoproteota archaeon TaxID=2056631 RepID=A0A497F228_9CREN|nr:MAG: arsenic-transporting ATPase [Candidatus Verstraetearchaeota archaeon]
MGVVHVEAKLRSLKDIVTPYPGERNRNVFFGGKGGVGKTTCAAAAAIWAADNGYKTLIASTDPAHSLAWVLEQKVGDKPTQVKEVKNLDAVQIDPQKLIEEQKEAIRQKIYSLIGPTLSGVEEYIDATAISPGVEEAATFDKFIEYLSLGNYDIIVFDTAPTGHTLRLISLSKVLGEWIENLIDVRKKALEMRKLVSRDIVVKEDEILKGLEDTKRRFETAKSIMTNPRKTTFIFVLIPEWTPILEAKRATKIIEDLGIKVEGVVVNQVLSPELSSIHEFLKSRSEMQLEHLTYIEKEFSGKVIVKVPLLEREVKGVSMLRRISQFMF